MFNYIEIMVFMLLQTKYVDSLNLPAIFGLLLGQVILSAMEGSLGGAY